MVKRRLIIGGTLAVAYIIILNLLVVAEAGSDGANIKNFGQAFWYSIVTLTTVGYGDHFPTTIAGKMVGFVFLLSSVGILSIVVGNITKYIQEGREKKKMGFNGTDFEQHIVALGWDSFAKSIVHALIVAGRKVAIITNQKDDIDIIRTQFNENDVFVLYSELDNYELMAKANIDKSAIVFLNLASDTNKLVAVLNIRRLYPNAEFLVSLDGTDLKDTFHSAGVTYAVSKNEIAAKLIASFIFEPDVAAYNADLISTAETDDDYDVQQYVVTEQNPYHWQTYGKAFHELKEKYNCVLIGISKKKDSTYDLMKLPPRRHYY